MAHQPIPVSNVGFLVAFLLAVLTFVACKAAAVPDPEVNALIGSWEVADTSGGMIQFGFRITETHDSMVIGVVQRVFSGNMGIDVSRFGALRGDVSDTRVSLRTDLRIVESSLEFEFERVGRGLRVVAIRLAGESLVGNPNTWVVRRV